MSEKYADAHLHAFHDKWKPGQFSQILKLAEENHIQYFLGGGYSPEDWVEQIKIHKKHPNFHVCFGIHPMWLHHQSEEQLESAMHELSRQAPFAAAIGETGLDLRSQFSGSFDLQAEYFRQHLELAELLNKPVVLHLVRSFSEAQTLLRLIGVPRSGGFIHAFNGPYEHLKAYCDLGLHISIGGAVTFSNNEKLREAIKKMDLNFLLIESDSPDQAPEGWGSDTNEPRSIFRIAQVIGSLRQMKEEDVLELATKNLMKLVPKLCQS